MFCSWLQSANNSQSLSSSLLFVNLELLLFLSKETEFYIYVTEVPLQVSAGVLHNSCASLQSEVDIFWNVDSLIAENGLHSCSRCSKESCVFRLTLVSKYKAW